MPCPICTSKNTHYFAHKDSYDYHRCSDCKTIFLHSMPTQKQLRVYYQKRNTYSDGLQNEKVIRKRSRIILRKIAHIVPHAKTLCDVGSSYGFFLDEAYKNGYISTGIEPSKQIARHTKGISQITTFIGELQDYLNCKHNQFDVVTCIHVLEHVRSPGTFISLLSQLVKPGGVLYIETPNSDSHLLYAEKNHYTFLLPPEHIWLFSKDSIQYFLPDNAKIICINTYSYSEHFMGIIKKIVLPVFRHSKQSEESRSSDRIKCFITPNSASLIKHFRYIFFDKLLAPLFTGLLNLYHKGSILELYIKINHDKSGL